VEQKNTRVARPKSHVTPNRRPQYPKNPHYYPPKSHTVHILLFTSLIIASFYRHALVIVPLKKYILGSFWLFLALVALFGSFELFWALKSLKTSLDEANVLKSLIYKNCKTWKRNKMKCQ